MSIEMSIWTSRRRQFLTRDRRWRGHHTLRTASAVLTLLSAAFQCSAAHGAGSCEAAPTSVCCCAERVPLLYREVQRILMELLNQMDGFDQTTNVKVGDLDQYLVGTAAASGALSCVVGQCIQSCVVGGLQHLT